MNHRMTNAVAAVAILLVLAVRAPASVSSTAHAAMAEKESQQPPLAYDVDAALRATEARKRNEVRNWRVPDVIGETDPGGEAAATYIVQLASAPLASYRGDVNGLSATSPSVTGERLSAMQFAAATYTEFLHRQQANVLAAIEARLGRSVVATFTYAVAFNGFALVLTPKEAAIVAGLPGVRIVQRDQLAQPHTDHGPAWIEAPTLWTGDQITRTRGEGIVVGVIDTGINFTSPSFAAVGGDNYVHTNPRGRYYGVCDPENEVFDPQFTCNDKLIGAWDFVDNRGLEDDGPEDSNGHGSHTASIAAGNHSTSLLVAPTIALSATIAGVAPHANIIAYDACDTAGCPFSVLVAAINQAVADEVDILNLSIGANTFDPWLSSTAQALLAALDAGAFLAVSAGNTGPQPATVTSPANAPWVVAVSATTHDRKFINQVVDLIGGGGTPPADIPGEGFTAGFGPASIIDAAAFGDPLCLSPFSPGAFSGKIVVCQRGGNGRVEKGKNALAGGAGGMILVNDQASGDSLNTDTHVLPAVHISYQNGADLKAWLASGNGHMGRIAGMNPQVDAANGDILGSFSSRGPDASLPDVLKPDVTAPGVAIFAAYRNAEGYNLLSGTSMAAPHVAGAATLLAALYPDWSPSAVRSALTLTAHPDLYKEDGATQADPFDRGAGRIDVAAAAKTGFVLDATAYDFEMADPYIGGDPTTLNLASLTSAACVGTCAWTRTLQSVQSTAETYTVSWTAPPSLTLSVEPAIFTLDPGGVQQITITADVGAASIDAWLFGQISIGAANPALSDAQMPVAAYSRAGYAHATLQMLDIQTRNNRGQYTLQGVRSIATNDLVKALYVGERERITDAVAPDPTSATPFDIAAGGVYTALIPVTDPETVQLAVATLDSTAPDLDLFIGFDANNDGLPSEDELECFSTTADALELCILDETLLGNYWILVQNWQGSGASLDSFVVEVTRVVRGIQSPSFTVTGPDTAHPHEPVDLTLAWDLPDFAPGNVRLALLEVGADSANPNNILSLPVALWRIEDGLSGFVDAPTAVQPGDIVTYNVQLSLEPSHPGPVGYTITATLPPGLQYLAGSTFLNSENGATAVQPILDGNQLVWQLENLYTPPNYVMSTNDPASPLFSEGCTTPYGASFVHLAGLGVPLWPTANGDGQTWDVDASFGGTGWYLFDGVGHPRLYFTDDALLSVVGYDPHLNSGVNAPIPSPALPNSLIAPYWADFKIVYDEAAQTGVRVGSDYGGDLMIVEYDGLQRADGLPGSLDVQAYIWRNLSDAYPEIVFAYDHITAPVPPGVIGLENGAGAGGLAYTGAIHNDLLVCFDWADAQVELTYAAQVKTDAPQDTVQTTMIQSSLHAPGLTGAQEQPSITVDLFVTSVALDITSSSPQQVGPGSPISYTYTVANSGPGVAENVLVTAQLPPGSRHVAGGALDGNLVSFTIPSLGPGATTALVYSVLMADASLVAAQAQTPEIIGGEEAEPGSWPWMAALWDNTLDWWYGCGGSLIDRRWVLTAAHCVTDTNGNVTPAGQLSVVLGRHDLASAAGQRIQVSEVIYHPVYELAASFDADIALLRLAEPAALTASVQPISLARDQDAPRFAAGVLSTVTGWGTRAPGANDFPDVLYQVEVPIVDLAACQFAYDQLGGEITANMICAGLPEGGKDACQGDSGGPLVVPDSANGWLQAGIVSWGIGCAEPSVPGVYTRVANFTVWVDDTQHTLTAGPYAASDGTGLPGHSAEGTTFSSTLVRPITLYLPIIEQ